jgi:hypothetical protein
MLLIHPISIHEVTIGFVNGKGQNECIDVRVKGASVLCGEKN